METIERQHPERLAEHVERLAHHAFRGEAWRKAVTYLRHAGAKAYARSANREAAAYFEQALDALRRLPEDSAAIAESLDIRFDLRNALNPLGEGARTGPSRRGRSSCGGRRRRAPPRPRVKLQGDPVLGGYRRTDKREQAREHLGIATTMYREMGMTYWLEKAEAEIID